jgi:hypothetical protein
MRAFRGIVCRVVLWVRVVCALLLRSICICRVIGVVNWRRREVGAAWISGLRLIVADSAVWRRRVVTAVLVRCVRLAVFIVAAYIEVSFRASTRLQWSVLTSFFAGITLALPVLVICVASSTHSTSSEASFC